MGKYTEISDSTLETAVISARGDFQRNLLRGVEAWSAMTLGGKAASYRGKYIKSGAKLLDRLRERGFIAKFERRDHGRKVAIIMTCDEAIEAWRVRMNQHSPLSPREELVALLADAPDPLHPDAQWLAGFLAATAVAVAEA